MFNENQNNLSPWKVKLDELDNLPGEAFNSSASWDKLHERMHQKPLHKKAALYWVAAACFLSVIILSVLFTNGKRTSLVKNTIRQNHSINISASPEPTFSNHVDEGANIFHFPKKQAKWFKAKTDKSWSLSTHIATGEKHLAGQEVVPENNLAEEVNTLPADTFKVVMTKIQIRPKLRVVHINELGQPATETKFARNEGNPFPVRITGKDIFSGSPTRTNPDHSFIKINLSPQN